MRKKILSTLALPFIGVGLYLLLLQSTDMTWELLRDSLGRLDMTIALVCPVLLAGLVFFSALKWRMVTEAQCEQRLGMGFYFRYLTLSSALGQLLPLTLTNATVRAVSLKRKDVMPVMKTAGLFIWDQGFDFLALFLLLASGLTHLFWGLSVTMTVLVFVGISTVILAVMPVFMRLITAAAALLGRLTWVPHGLKARFQSFSEAAILTPAFARRLFLLSVGKFLIGSTFYTCVVLASGQPDLLGIAFWGAPSAEMAGVLSQMPGGLGALDWTWVGIFTGQGMNAQAAAALVIGIRCALFSCNIINAACTWFVYLAFFKFRKTVNAA